MSFSVSSISDLIIVGVDQRFFGRAGGVAGSNETAASSVGMALSRAGDFPSGAQGCSPVAECPMFDLR